MTNVLTLFVHVRARAFCGLHPTGSLVMQVGEESANTVHPTVVFGTVTGSLVCVCVCACVCARVREDRCMK